MTHPQQAPHGFRRFLCNSCGHFIDVPIHCSSKACGVCTAIRGWRIRERIQYALQGMKQDRVYRWRHIVLTVKNSYDLDDRLDHLVKSFRKLRQRKLWKSTQYGGFYVIEITEGTDGWHPHLHIVSYGSFLPWRKLRAAWLALTKDSYHVTVVSIRDGSNIGYYISKYITKVHTLSAASIVTLDEICRNRRLFGPFGKCALLMKKFRPPDKFHPCPKCGVHEWIPEFILDMMNRRATQFT